MRLVGRLESRRDIAAIYQDPRFSFIDKCFYPWMVARIDPYGRVIPCTGSRLPMGDLRHERLEAVWNGPAYQQLRADLAAARLFPECAKCNTLAGGRWACWNWLPAAADRAPEGALS